MQYRAGHNNVTENTMQQQAAGCKKAGANVAQANFFSYFCMFKTFGNTITKNCRNEKK